MGHRPMLRVMLERLSKQSDPGSVPLEASPEIRQDNGRTGTASEPDHHVVHKPAPANGPVA
jgi:hypothetical protein